MTSSKIMFSTYDPAIANWRNKPDDRCNIKAYHTRKTCIKKKKVKISIQIGQELQESA